MKFYRSLDVIEAVQYTGTPIPGVTCGGSDAEHRVSGCDPSRRYHTHVHSEAIGGMTVLRPGDWIYPVNGGPFGVADDQKFRGRFEVPAEVPTDEPPTEVALVPDEPPAEVAPLVPDEPPTSIVEDLKAIDTILAEAQQDAPSRSRKTKEASE